jgi:hypothetical protein
METVIQFPLSHNFLHNIGIFKSKYIYTLGPLAHGQYLVFFLQISSRVKNMENYIFYNVQIIMGFLRIFFCLLKKIDFWSTSNSCQNMTKLNFQQYTLLPITSFCKFSPLHFCGTEISYINSLVSFL